MSDYLPTLESGIDYITSTFTWAEWNVMGLDRAAGTMQRELEKRGEYTKPARILGYDCWVTGPLTWGTRTDGVLLRVSSADADTYVNRFPALLIGARRIDLQATLYHGKAAQAALRAAINSAAAARDTRPEAQRFNLEFYSSPEGPQTLYIGSRATEHFGRVYDKGRQSKDEYYEGTLRYEVEFKGTLATKVGQELYRCPFATSYQAGPAVRDWFALRGVDVPGGFVSGYWPLPRIDAVTTDEVVKLRWLYTQVRQTVRSLLRTCSQDVVYYSLGLLDEADLSPESAAKLKGEDNAT